MNKSEYLRVLETRRDLFPAKSQILDLNLIIKHFSLDFLELLINHLDVFNLPRQLRSHNPDILQLLITL